VDVRSSDLFLVVEEVLSMKGRNIRENLTAIGLKRVLSHLDSNPETNMPRIIDWMDRWFKPGGHDCQASGCTKRITDPNGSRTRLVKSFWTDIDDIRKKIFENFVVSNCRPPVE
jgi:hypothetical protein